MAARRLLLVLLILLAISTIATLLAAPFDERGDGTTTATTEQTEAPAIEGPTSDGDGRLLTATIDAGDARTDVIPVGAGDQLVLRVSSRRADQVEIPALGVVDAVERGSPATFDLLLDQPGTYKVRFVSNRDVVGRLLVTRDSQGE